MFFCAVRLAGLLVFGMTPAEAIHSFADHEDTAHGHDGNRDGPGAEPEHHHCDFLTFHLPPFDTPPFVAVVLGRQSPCYVAYQATQAARPSQQAISLREGSGPPAAALRLT